MSNSNFLMSIETILKNEYRVSLDITSYIGISRDYNSYVLDPLWVKPSFTKIINGKPDKI